MATALIIDTGGGSNFDNKHLRNLASLHVGGAALASGGVLEVTGDLKVSGEALLDPGSVGAPAYSWILDPDSGLYRIGANNIGIAVNGVKQLDISEAGVAGTRSYLVFGGVVPADPHTGSFLFTWGERVFGGNTFFDISYRPPRAGSITGISVFLDEFSGSRDAGTLTAEVQVNGAGIGLTAQINGTDTVAASATQNPNVDAFAAKDRIGVQATTSAFSATVPTGGKFGVMAVVEITT